jgi:hypothetical protein
MFSLANAELEELSKRFNWPVLTREYTFPTVAGTAQYALPADYRKFLQETIFDSTRYYAMRGSLSAGEWQRTKAHEPRNAKHGARTYLRQPAQAEHSANACICRKRCVRVHDEELCIGRRTGETLRYSADNDVALIDEALIRMGLKWRIKHAKGLEFSADLAEYEAVVAREFAAALAQPALGVGFSRCDDGPLTQGYTPENGFG